MTEQLTVVAHLRALNGQIEETKKFLMALIEPTTRRTWLRRILAAPGQ